MAGSRVLGWPFGPLVKLLILTGQRRDEVARMPWAELDLAERLWRLPRERTKNNRPHEIPLSDAAMAVLDSMPRIDGPYVFSTNGEGPASNYAKNKRKFDALLPADMPAWRLHDLRRTVASGMARLGIGLPVIEKVLNHTSGSFAGIVGVYQQHTFADEKRQALEAWGAFVTDLASDQPPAQERRRTARARPCVGSRAPKFSHSPGSWAQCAAASRIGARWPRSWPGWSRRHPAPGDPGKNWFYLWTDVDLVMRQHSCSVPAACRLLAKGELPHRGLRVTLPDGSRATVRAASENWKGRNPRTLEQRAYQALRDWRKFCGYPHDGN